VAAGVVTGRESVQLIRRQVVYYAGRRCVQISWHKPISRVERDNATNHVTREGMLVMQYFYDKQTSIKQ
jgi:hypothetical protein